MKLNEILIENQLDLVKSDYILTNFNDYQKIADEWEAKAKTIVVTSDDQKADMKIAREGRLFLKDKRVAIEKARKMLKEQSLREGKAIDSIAKYLTALIEPIEEYLENQEKFTENRIKKEKEELKATRNGLLSEYEPLGYPNVEELTEEQFQALLNGYEQKKKEQEEERQRLEKEREEKEKADREERERLRIENEKLQKENAERRAREEAEALERKRLEDENKKLAEKVVEAEKVNHTEDLQDYIKAIQAVKIPQINNYTEVKRRLNQFIESLNELV